jgi:hypothetical protein
MGNYYTSPYLALLLMKKWSECSGSHKANKMYNRPVDRAELFTAKYNSISALRQIKQAIPNIPFEDFDAKEVQ